MRIRNEQEDGIDNCTEHGFIWTRCLDGNYQRDFYSASIWGNNQHGRPNRFQQGHLATGCQQLTTSRWDDPRPDAECPTWGIYSNSTLFLHIQISEAVSICMWPGSVIWHNTQADNTREHNMGYCDEEHLHPVEGPKISKGHSSTRNAKYHKGTAHHQMDWGFCGIYSSHHRSAYDSARLRDMWDDSSTTCGISSDGWPTALGGEWISGEWARSLSRPHACVILIRQRKGILPFGGSHEDYLLFCVHKNIPTKKIWTSRLDGS